MTHFLHPNGSIETTPPVRRDIIEAENRASRDSEYGGDKRVFTVNRLAYKAAIQQDPYKYKYEEIET